MYGCQQQAGRGPQTNDSSHFPPRKRQALQNQSDLVRLETHPNLGSVWEGFTLQEICRQMKVTFEECFFRDTQGDEN